MKNLFDVTGKVVVITGACGVLGQCIARYLAEQGAHVVILARAHSRQVGQLTQTWTRTSIRNDAELVDMCSKSVGILSRKTILLFFRRRFLERCFATRRKV